MTDISAFVKSVLPDAPLFCLAHLSSRGMKHVWVPGRDAIAPQVEILKKLYPQDNIYYAYAGYSDRRRRRANVTALRTFVLDVDCGKEGGYPDQASAIDALVAHVKAGRLLRPTWIVSSGNGLHLYWVVDEDVDPLRWTAIAKEFKKAMVQIDPKMAVDTSRMADAAGLLRLPGTDNIKGGVRKPVTVLKRFTDHTLDAFRAFVADTIGATVVAPASQTPLGANPYGAVKDETVKIEDDVVPRAKALADACPVFAYAVVHQAQAGYDEWRNTVQLCAFLQNGRKVAHFVSDRHPDYDPAKVDEKYDDAVQSRNEGVGPVTCEVYADSCGRPDLCAGCRYRGVKSPLVAARRLQRDMDAAEQAKKAASIASSVTREDVPEEQEPDVRELFNTTLAALSKLMHGRLSVAPDGKIILTETDQNTGMSFAREAFGAPVIPIGKIGSSDGALIRFAVFTPDIERIERTVDIPLVDLHTSQLISRAATMFKAAIPIGSPSEKTYRAYFGAILAYANSLPEIGQQVECAGFVGNRHFVFGERIIAKDPEKDRTAVLDGNAAVVLGTMKMNGTLDGHIRFLRKFFDTAPDFAKYQLLAATGSVLIHMLGVGGTVLHIHGHSGMGKTLATYLASSIYGKPTATTLGPRDTVNAIEAKLRALNHMPAMFDEVTPAIDRAQQQTMQGLENLIFSITNGHGRDRATRTGAVRKAAKGWKLVAITTGNRSIYEVLSSMSSSAVSGALINRVVEYTVPASQRFDDQKSINELIRMAEANYGHIGAWFVREVLRNYDTVYNALVKVFEALQDKYGSERRFANALHACVVLTARIFGGMGISVSNSFLQKMRASLEDHAQETLQESSEHDPDTMDFRMLLDYLMPRDRTITFLENEHGDMVFVSGTREDSIARLEIKKNDVLLHLRSTQLVPYLRSIGLPTTPATIKRRATDHPECTLETNRRIPFMGGVPDRNGLVPPVVPPEPVITIRMTRRFYEGSQ